MHGRKLRGARGANIPPNISSKNCFLATKWEGGKLKNINIFKTIIAMV